MNATNEYYKQGLKDGAEMARDSASDEAPENGWAGSALAEAGLAALLKSFGLPADTDSESPVFRAAMEAYDAGCQAGATGQIESEEDEEERYRIAFVKENGDFDVVEFFSAADDDAANAYAQSAYCDQEWYVINASGQNINGDNEDDDAMCEEAADNPGRRGA